MFVTSLTSDTFSSNTASSIFASGGGGGVFNFGILDSENTTYSGNMSNASTNSFGGGLTNLGVVTSTNDTFVGNVAINGLGSGIFNEGTLTTVNDTIAGNFGEYGVYFQNGSWIALNTIVIANYLSNQINDELDFNSGNAFIEVFTNTPIGSLLANTVNNFGLRIPLLANNGGPTQTVADVPNSDAIRGGTDLDFVTSGISVAISNSSSTFNVNGLFGPTGPIFSGGWRFAAD